MAGMPAIIPMSDRLPPHNIEAESGVLGSMLLDNSTVELVREWLKPEDFYRDTHQIICAAIYALAEAGKAADLITVQEELRRRGQLEKIGGEEAIFSLLHSVPHAANSQYYGQIVVQKATSRQAIDAAHEVLRCGYSNEYTAEEIVETAESAILKIRLDRERSPGGYCLESAAEAINLALKAQRGEFQGITCGVDDLDTLIGGIRAPQLVVVGARPGNGKTSLGMQFAAQCIRFHNLAVLFVSLEMNRLELSGRWLFSESRIDYDLFRKGKSTLRSIDADTARLDKTWHDSQGFAPMFIDDHPSRTPSGIASAARRFSSRCFSLGRPLGLVVIDYIQLINGENPRAPRHEQVADTSRRLKILAKELNVPVLALSQLNRASENREDKRPRMADLRESGAIEQDADLVVLLHRPDMYDPNDNPGTAEIDVVKNRAGATGRSTVAYLRHFTRFESLSPYQEPI